MRQTSISFIVSMPTLAENQQNGGKPRKTQRKIVVVKFTLKLKLVKCMIASFFPV